MQKCFRYLAYGHFVASYKSIERYALNSEMRSIEECSSEKPHDILQHFPVTRSVKWPQVNIKVELTDQLTCEIGTDFVLFSEQYQDREQPIWFSYPLTLLPYELPIWVVPELKGMAAQTASSGLSVGRILTPVATSRPTSIFRVLAIRLTLWTMLFWTLLGMC